MIGIAIEEGLIDSILEDLTQHGYLVQANSNYNVIGHEMNNVIRVDETN